MDSTTEKGLVRFAYVFVLLTSIWTAAANTIVVDEADAKGIGIHPPKHKQRQDDNGQKVRTFDPALRGRELQQQEQSQAGGNAGNSTATLPPKDLTIIAAMPLFGNSWPAGLSMMAHLQLMVDQVNKHKLLRRQGYYSTSSATVPDVDPATGLPTYYHLRVLYSDARCWTGPGIDRFYEAVLFSGLTVITDGLKVADIAKIFYENFIANKTSEKSKWTVREMSDFEISGNATGIMKQLGVMRSVTREDFPDGIQGYMVECSFSTRAFYPVLGKTGMKIPHIGMRISPTGLNLIIYFLCLILIH